jgi:hypothetical protein
MQLHVLKEGAKDKVKLGFCCFTPWSYSDWAEPDGETAYLKRRSKKSQCTTSQESTAGRA